jgi:UDP-glucose 4-epimerase
MHVMVCGGAGYIGSHTCVALHERGHDITIVDNFSSSSPDALQRLESLLGRALDAHCLDIRDGAGLAALFSRRRYDAVVHLAALTSAADARERPLAYFDNNIAGSIALLRSMREAGVGQLVFSSSAIADSAGFGDAPCAPLAEDTPLSCANPYSRTAAVVEQLIGDVCAADPGLRAISLRYFHAAGAHRSGLIGETAGALAGTATGSAIGPTSDPLQAICQTAAGLRECVQIYGDDWPTIDGTCVRDYLHVMDLARAHADALGALRDGTLQKGVPQDDVLEADGGHLSINLGRGGGVSVLQMLRTFEAVSGQTIPHRVLARRVGDVAEIYADPRRAEAFLGWRAELGVEEICRDTWRRQLMQSDDTPVGEV